MLLLLLGLAVHGGRWRTGGFGGAETERRLLLLELLGLATVEGRRDGRRSLHSHPTGGGCTWWRRGHGRGRGAAAWGLHHHARRRGGLLLRGMVGRRTTIGGRRTRRGAGRAISCRRLLLLVALLRLLGVAGHVAWWSGGRRVLLLLLLLVLLLGLLMLLLRVAVHGRPVLRRWRRRLGHGCCCLWRGVLEGGGVGGWVSVGYGR